MVDKPHCPLDDADHQQFILQYWNFLLFMAVLACIGDLSQIHRVDIYRK